MRFQLQKILLDRDQTPISLFKWRETASGPLDYVREQPTRENEDDSDSGEADIDFPEISDQNL